MGAGKKKNEFKGSFERFKPKPKNGKRINKGNKPKRG